MKSDERYVSFIIDCAVELEVTIDDVVTRGKGDRGINEARQLIAWALRERYRLSFPHIGRLLNRDHTTIMVATRKVQRALDDRAGWAVRGISAVNVAPAQSLQIETALETLGCFGAEAAQ